MKTKKCLYTQLSQTQDEDDNDNLDNEEDQNNNTYTTFENDTYNAHYENALPEQDFTISKSSRLFYILSKLLATPTTAPPAADNIELMLLGFFSSLTCSIIPTFDGVLGVESQ